jgi:hypothetical protein
MQRQVDPTLDLGDVEVVPSEDGLLSALRAGDEGVFTELVKTQTPSLIRLARLNLGDLAAAEEVSSKRPGSASSTASSGSRGGRR